MSRDSLLQPTSGRYRVFSPGKGGAQADFVITAPEGGVPLLFVEIDHCHESVQVLAAEIDKYMRFGQRKAKDVDGKERPLWRTRRCCSSSTGSARATRAPSSRIWPS